MFTFTIIFGRHVSNVTSHDKISPIIFTFTIIFCRHVSNVTSCDKISPIIFTFTIIFCRHVSNVTSRDITWQISPILGCRAPLGATIKYFKYFHESNERIVSFRKKLVKPSSCCFIHVMYNKIKIKIKTNILNNKNQFILYKR